MTVDLSEATLGDDLLVRNVVILGKQSKNSDGKVFREYSNAAMESAVRIFEGMPAFIDHQEKGKATQHRSVKDMFGTYKNVKVDLQEEKVRGDLQLYDHTLGQHVAAIIKVNPRAVGNSINTGGKVVMRNGIQIVEEIFARTPAGVKASVDLVGDPATTSSLFESTDLDKESEMDLKDLTLAELREQRPDLFDKLIAEGKTQSSGDLAKLTEEIKTLKDEAVKLTESKQALTVKVDAFGAKEAMASQHKEVDALLTEAKLPKEAVTEVFKSILYALVERKDGDKTITVKEQATSLIEDRKITLGLKGVKGNHEKVPVKESTGEKLSTKDIMTELAEATKVD